MVCLRKVVLLEERAVTPALGRWSPVSGITLGRQEEGGLPPPGGSVLLVRCLLQHPPAAVLRDARWDALCRPSSLPEGGPMLGVCSLHLRRSGWVSLSPLLVSLSQSP